MKPSHLDGFMCHFQHMQAAAAALDAGSRRKALARSIASASSTPGVSSSSCSSGSGKRGHLDLKPTPSTKVTPDSKVSCSRRDAVEPCKLMFDGDSSASGQTMGGEDRHFFWWSHSLKCAYSKLVSKNLYSAMYLYVNLCKYVFICLKQFAFVFYLSKPHYS